MQEGIAMNCRQCQELFTSHLDGDLGDDRRGGFIAHLAACPNCAADLQLFQQAVSSLHAIPENSPPANFLPGIHAKLAQPSLSKIRRWFTFMGQHKLAASTALATMMVAVISATVIQLETGTPSLPSQVKVASISGPGHRLTGPVADLATPNHNYYPGVPYLTPQTSGQQQSNVQPLVQFASTARSSTLASYHSQLADRAPPSFSTGVYPSVAMDMNVSVNPTTRSQQHALIQQLVNQSVGFPQMQGNTIYIKMPASQLASLQRIFAPADPHLCRADLAKLRSQRQSNRLLNIAVTFRP